MRACNKKKGLFEFPFSVVPIYLAKGLEFDAVLLVDVDAEHYKGTTHDAKLLYVGCTRALHDLQILYSGEASLLLKGIDTKMYEEE